MTPEIIRRLQQLEVEQGVKILYVCESAAGPGVFLPATASMTCALSTCTCRMID